MARAGPTELTISLLARWGSSAVRTYIRKAPLAASHRMAAMAISGWNRNLDPAGGAPPFAGSAAQASSTRRQLAPLAKNRATSRAALTAVRGRLSQAEQQLRELTEWRSTFKASVPEVPVEQVGDLLDEVPPCWVGTLSTQRSLLCLAFGTNAIGWKWGTQTTRARGAASAVGHLVFPMWLGRY